LSSHKIGVMVEHFPLVVVVGSGGHANDIVAALLDSDTVRVVGFAGDRPPSSPASGRLGVSYLGPIEDVGSRAGFALVAVGDPHIRRELASRAAAAGLAAMTFVHPRAHVGAGVELGEGCVLLAQSCISSTASLGVQVHVNVGASISHDSVLGDYVTVNPGARVSGSTVLGVDVTVGAGAVLRDGITVGRGSFIGAGSVVTVNLPEGVVAYGVPARIRRYLE